MRLLTEITDKIELVNLIGDPGRTIRNICFDSRDAGRGDLFIAVKGTITDGHNYIDNSLKSGVTAVICEILPENPSTDICWVVVEDSALALGEVASLFYDSPSGKMKLVGITGTNGKTTVATLLYNLFMELGYKCGLISTIGNYIIKKEIPATHTTPDSIQLNRMMSEMVDAGCDYLFMEVSSHAVDQKRIAGLEFDGALFTNLTHDHLDYHKTFDNYLIAKKRFFDSLSHGSFALVNSDDKNGQVMLQNCTARKYTFSVRGMADYRCRILEQRFEGMLIRIDDTEVSTRFIGDFNASNLLAVYGTALLLGAAKIEILTTISKLYPAPGRLEIIRSATGKTAIVDYAHTPDALRNVIAAINRIEFAGNLITVVGAGGDRDRGKRAVMAGIAVAGSERIIFTSDNPRNEDPDRILDDMMDGVGMESNHKVLRIKERREAIKTAVMLATDDDIILIAGKGHETYQETNGVRTCFDDREEIRKIFGLKQKNRE